MTTIGWVFILIAGLLVRGLTRGRSIGDLPGDLGAMFNAVTTGDQKALRDALALTGDTNTVTLVNAAPIVTNDKKGSNALLSEVHKLGSGATYSWGAIGPTSYDCSGLVWRAMKNLGIYTGPRFTTTTFPIQCRGVIAKTNTPISGDVVVWQIPGHMGVVDGPDSFYSALSKKSGIRSMSISKHGGKPTFYKVG